MLDGEVLVGELVTEDGLPTGALSAVLALVLVTLPPSVTYIAASEVTTLGHEASDHTVELRARVAEALLACREGTEVVGGIRDNIVVQLEH